MKCKYDKCDNELIGRQKNYCSDRCRKAQTRTNTDAKSDKTKVGHELGQSMVQGLTGSVVQTFEGMVSDAQRLMPEQIVKLTKTQADEILAGWAQGKGSERQVRLGRLSQAYTKIKEVA